MICADAPAETASLLFALGITHAYNTFAPPCAGEPTAPPLTRNGREGTPAGGGGGPAAAWHRILTLTG
ncbi:hypothetical protein [Candidatus Chloroploca asiatica]|uniref:Uncharacterized protein n=1 Tax=Candidatus Chloroploca asiatica TaxID=1506545 RepID=A0A2H3KRS8_9CHLR|nr:hypothetical protein [Candidatus Chloroploca asiatica]PDW01343.1 hypothetical protein A9Q02_21100 [Candidatus Chloroploca asiatica]